MFEVERLDALFSAGSLFMEFRRLGPHFRRNRDRAKGSSFSKHFVPDLHSPVSWITIQPFHGSVRQHFVMLPTQ
jgi:hypothetical protein